MKNVVIWFFFCITSSTVLAKGSDSSPLAKNYINKYHEIAVQEMRRTGIPASIKLAQGLLESDWGRSDLAKVANNHFGIKCGSSWSGKEFYKTDDDYDKKGNLMQSCFRVFKDDRHSYKAHSDFLKDPKKEYRYGFLFNYPSNDYRSWAQGLLDAGYATDKKYPEKLILVIEKYELHQFDEMVFLKNGELASGEDVPDAQAIISYKAKERHFKSIPTSNKGQQKITAINRIPMTIASQEMTLEEMALRVGLSVDLLIQYNDGYDDASSIVERDAIVYLQKKKRSFTGKITEHIVLEGETMESISQLYGIRLANLFAKNRMPKDAYPLLGEKLQLRKTVASDQRPKFTRKSGRVPETFLADMKTKGQFERKEAIVEGETKSRSRVSTPKTSGPISKKRFCPKNKSKGESVNSKPTGDGEKVYHVTDMTKEMLDK